MKATRVLAWVWLLLASALGGSLGYGFLGFQGGWQAGGGGFGVFQEVALGGESWGGPSGYGGGFLAGPWLPVNPGVFLLPALGLGGESRGGSGGFLLDLGVRGFWFLRAEGGWLLGVGAGYALPLGFSGGGWYLRFLAGGGRP
ncbi:hypothetical protein FJNA_13260 [Thermus sp. FJN-A]